MALVPAGSGMWSTLLRYCIPAEEVQYVLTDMYEEHARISAIKGPSSAFFWFQGQMFLICGYGLRDRCWPQ